MCTLSGRQSTTAKEGQAMSEKAFTIPEVAKLEQVSPSTVRREIDRGALQAYRSGGQVRIKPSALEAYRDQQTIRAAR